MNFVSMSSKKGISLIIVFLLSITAFAQDSINNVDSKGRKQGNWIKKSDDGKSILYKGQFKNDNPVGKFVFYYPNGIVRAINIYSNNGKDSYAATYFENEQLMSYGKYINKEKDSLWTYYDDEGNLSMTEEYMNGNINGKKTVYYPYKPGVTAGSPKILEQTIYKDGLKHGPWAQYYESGQKIGEGVYELDDYEGKQTYYYSSGEIQHEYNYKNGLKHGFFRTLDKQGEVISKTYFWEGKVLEGELLEKHLERLRKKKQEEIDNNKENQNKN